MRTVLLLLIGLLIGCGGSSYATPAKESVPEVPRPQGGHRGDR